MKTHRGSLQHNRQFFGIKCAPVVFQQVMNTMLNDIPFAKTYVNDVIIASRSEKERYDHL